MTAYCQPGCRLIPTTLGVPACQCGGYGFGPFVKAAPPRPTQHCPTVGKACSDQHSCQARGHRQGCNWSKCLTCSQGKCQYPLVCLKYGGGMADFPYAPVGFYYKTDDSLGAPIHL